MNEVETSAAARAVAPHATGTEYVATEVDEVAAVSLPLVSLTTQ